MLAIPQTRIYGEVPAQILRLYFCQNIYNHFHSFFFIFCFTIKGSGLSTHLRKCAPDYGFLELSCENTILACFWMFVSLRGKYVDNCFIFCFCKGKHIMAVHCDTNDAKVVTLSYSEQSQKYTCHCKGTLSTGDSKMYCYVHYWECPVST